MARLSRAGRFGVKAECSGLAGSRAKSPYRVAKTLKTAAYDAIVLAVNHDEFKAMGARKIRRFAKKVHVLYDVKYMFAHDQTDGRL